MSKESLLSENNNDINNVCEDCIMEFAIDFPSDLTWKAGTCDCCGQETLITSNH